MSNQEKIDLAKSTDDAALLADLARDEDFWVRRYVAANLNTLPDTLAELARDVDWIVRERVAQNPSIPPDTLAELAHDDDTDVRYLVAVHLNTPEDVLRELARDEDADVCEAVADNPHTPSDLLAELARDEDDSIAYAVASNPNTPIDSLIELSGSPISDDIAGTAIDTLDTLEISSDKLREIAEKAHDERRVDLLGFVARHPCTPEDVLRELAKSEFVACDAFMNPSTPIDAVAEAIFSEDDHISSTALEAFKYRELRDSPSKRAAAARALADSLGISDSANRSIHH